MGLNRPRDCARVVASLACPQPCSPQSPDGEGTSRVDVSPSGQEVTCGEQGCSELSSPGLFIGESPGDRSNCLEQFRAPRQSLPRWRVLLQGAPLIQEAAGIVLPPCLSEPPQVGPGPGWAQPCLYRGFSLDPGPALGLILQGGRSSGAQLGPEGMAGT